jgi:hypothetical protein
MSGRGSWPTRSRGSRRLYHTSGARPPEMMVALHRPLPSGLGSRADPPSHAVRPSAYYGAPKTVGRAGVALLTAEDGRGIACNYPGRPIALGGPAGLVVDERRPHSQFGQGFAIPQHSLHRAISRDGHRRVCRLRERRPRQCHGRDHQRVVQSRGDLETGAVAHREAIEHATLSWVHWFNTKRLLAPIGNIPPAEFEESYYSG